MLSKPKRVVTVATDDELLNEHYYRRQWLAARNLKASRRKWLDILSDTFVLDDVTFIYPSGLPYMVPDIDTVFGEDPDMRWFSYYLLDDGTEQYPRIRSRILSRLRLIDLYFRVRHPRIAAHFGK